MGPPKQIGLSGICKQDLTVGPPHPCLVAQGLLFLSAAAQSVAMRYCLAGGLHTPLSLRKRCFPGSHDFRNANSAGDLR